jgi:hypothetical protein
LCLHLLEQKVGEVFFSKAEAKSPVSTI